jgi:hypothetical protein
MRLQTNALILNNNKNPFGLSQRLWQYHLQQCGIDTEIRWADLPAKLQNQWPNNCVHSHFM